MTTAHDIDHHQFLTDRLTPEAYRQQWTHQQSTTQPQLS